jgi:hypothetical protein
MSTKFDEVTKKLDDVQFRGLYGHTKTTMKAMVDVLREAYAAKHRRRGRRAKLDVADTLLLACKYWREYVTFLSLANEFGVAESTTHDTTVWVENVLIKSGRFDLPGKKHF